MVALDLMLCIMWTGGEAEDEGLHQVPLLISTASNPIKHSIMVPNPSEDGLFLSMSGPRQRPEVVSAEVLQLKLSPAFLSAVKTKRRMLG